MTTCEFCGQLCPNIVKHVLQDVCEAPLPSLVYLDWVCDRQARWSNQVVLTYTHCARIVPLSCVYLPSNSLHQGDIPCQSPDSTLHLTCLTDTTIIRVFEWGLWPNRHQTITRPYGRVPRLDLFHVSILRQPAWITKILTGQVQTDTPHIFCLTTTTMIWVFVAEYSSQKSLEFTGMYPHFTAFMLSTSANVLQSLRYAGSHFKHFKRHRLGHMLNLLGSWHMIQWCQELANLSSIFHSCIPSN